MASTPEPRTFEISSVEEAVPALDHFNGFHDGFMKRIVIASQDAIQEDRGQTCTGRFDVEIDFAHYNYPPGALRPFDQIVHARFLDVQDIFCDCREGFLGNTITRLAVVLGSRRKGGTTSVEPCLALHLGRQFYLEEYRRYEYRESRFFTFARAIFREGSP